MRGRMIFVGLGLLFLSLVSQGQDVTPRAFQDGERVSYYAYYNWNFVWLHAGNVTFKVDSERYNNQESYRFQAIGITLKTYDWFYKVRDYFQSYVRKDNLSPVFFERNTREGRYRVHNRYYFDYKNKEIFSQTENSNEPYEENYINLEPPVFDVLSAIYYSRNIDFDNLQIGQKIPLPMIIDNEIYNLFIRYQGRETIDVKNLGRYKCIKFSAMLVEGTIFEKGEHLTVWVTDDQNRIPLMVEAKILVGSVKAIFKSAENLKYPSPLS